MLKRRLPLVLVVAAVCGALATLRTLRLPVVYAASARLELAREAPDPTVGKGIWYYEGLQQQYVNTQIEILGSNMLAAEVLEGDPELARELEVDAGTDDPRVLAGRLQAGVRATGVPATYLVDVSYESTDSERCARYANAVAEAYLRKLGSRRGEKTQLALDKIADQIDKLGAKLETAEEERRRFLVDGRAPLFESAEELLVMRINASNDALARVQNQRNRLDAELEALQRVLEDGRPLESAPSIATNEVIRKLREQLSTAELELVTLSERYGTEWPQVRAARAKVDQLKLLLRREVETSRSQLQSERDARTAEEQGLLQRSRALKEESRAHAKRKLRYQNLNEEVAATRRLYDEFFNRFNELARWGQVNVTNASLVDRARGAGRVRPNHTRNVGMGVMFGLVLGVALALLLERLTDRLKTLQEASSVLQLPVLGVVPDISEVAGKALDRYALTSSRSVYAEAFRRARVQLNAVGAYPDEGCGVLLCSSGLPREGKTLCAINLAVASALSGKKTLLIDADMRSPRTHRVFETALSPGLADLLQDRRLEAEAIQASDVPNLWLLCAGKARDNPAELLARGPEFPQLIADLRERYDRILIDSPPVAAVSDGTLMAPSADASLLIVSAKASSRTASLLAKTELSRVGREPTGLLFNQQEAGAAGYYYSYYRRYYRTPKGAGEQDG